MAAGREGGMQPEAHAIDGGAGDLGVEGRSRGEEPPHLLHPEDGGEPVGGGHAHKRARGPVTLEDGLIEEAKAAGAETPRRGGEASAVFAVADSRVEVPVP